jgi:hypothetical protein
MGAESLVGAAAGGVFAGSTEACRQADGSWRITQTTPGLPPQVYEVPASAASQYPSAYSYPEVAFENIGKRLQRRKYIAMVMTNLVQPINLP